MTFGFDPLRCNCWSAWYPSATARQMEGGGGVETEKRGGGAKEGRVRTFTVLVVQCWWSSLVLEFGVRVASAATRLWNSALNPCSGG